MIEARNRETRVEWAKRLFRNEVHALQDTAELPQTPALFAYSTDQQTIAYDHSGGYINAIAMQKMPGRPVPVYIGLTDSEVSHITKEVARIIEDIRQCGWAIDEGFPDKPYHQKAQSGTYPPPTDAQTAILGAIRTPHQRTLAARLTHSLCRAWLRIDYSNDINPLVEIEEETFPSAVTLDAPDDEDVSLYILNDATQYNYTTWTEILSSLK
ncbi:hypothetical protein SI65_09802 [Aspergillus cristatus]|uniref:Uncharacterized protein n=1 Tax=Aspergillus cristatus TaxID=573508 RepID=A0A1E3B1M0_ASPCR|nr:hypothetical protein SI65_09802 [Aspergillus cristatus]